MPTVTPPPFEIGLSFTGTVSGGAYTAGVVDFILDALEQWQQKKDDNRKAFGEDYTKWNVPWHDVIIKGISGASGGGVTCGLILNSIGKANLNPLRNPPPPGPTANDFYDAWINQLGLVQLMDTPDITPSSNKVISLLNANAIPNVANNLMKPSLFGNTAKRKYIDDNLNAFITVTNLRGIPYQIPFLGIGPVNPNDPNSNPTILYTRHTDYVRFELAKNDITAYTNKTILIPYTIALPSFMPGYSQLKQASLATCAFPAAFKPQALVEDILLYINRNTKAPLAFPATPCFVYDFLCVDGGILNTQPFELLHDFIYNNDSDSNKTKVNTIGILNRDADAVIKSIIMVAPLQTYEDFNDIENDITKNDIVSVAPQIINAMRQEAMFTAEQIGMAFDENIYDRFIIAPVRYTGENSTERIYPAITATMLNAFGAFLSPKFCEHDYFLGRRNAQQFLRSHFVLPLPEAQQNPIVGSGAGSSNLTGFRYTDPNTKKTYFPIIPLCGEADDKNLYFPVWPKGQGYTIDGITELLQTRVDALIGVVLNQLNLGGLTRWAVKTYLSVKKVNQKIVNNIVAVIAKALDDYEL